MTMIVTRTNNAGSIQSPWSVTEHVAELDAKYEPTYSVGDKFRADLVERLVRATFYKSDVFRNYRKKFIAVKVCSPSKDELISDNCRQLFEVCNLNGFEVVHTRTGVIVRIRPL